MDTMTEKKVLVLGARGRFGGAAVQAFAAAGWQVLAQARPGRAGQPLRNVQWLAMELDDTQALADAAQGCSVVVHALNPAYTAAAWKQQVPRFMEAAIAVATRCDALLMLPGNVYNYGSGMPALLSEDTPQQPDTLKGRLRMQAEQQMQRACETAGLRAVVIRAGDFFGSGTGSWFDRLLVKDLRHGVLNYPGRMDVPTAWAYLPDLGRAFVQVAERRAQLAGFETFHFAGYSLTGQDWANALADVAWEQGWLRAGGTLKVKHLPWGVIRLGALVVPTWAALVEMRYLWETPHTLDGRKLGALGGGAAATPFADAVRASMADAGLLRTAVASDTALVGSAS